MTKKSTPKGPGKPFNPGASQGGFRPTVGLPASAMGRAPTGPTVGLPPGAKGGVKPGAAPSRGQVSQEDITRLLQLGGSHLAAGRLDHAGKAAAAVLSVQPKNPDGFHLLGLVALGKGDPVTAEKLIARAAASMPRHVNVWVNLGNAQRDQGKMEEALISYHRAELIRPDYPDIFLNRGQLHSDAAQYSEAIAEFDRVIALTPSEPSPYLRAASAATRGGRYRDALAYCYKAIDRLEAVPMQIKTILATTYEQLSELDEAIVWAERALEENPKNGDALGTWSKAQRRRRKNDPTLVAELRRRLENAIHANVSGGEARHLLGELAHICDVQGDVVSAFDYFTKMNAETSRQPGLAHVDRHKFSNDVVHLREVMTSDFVAKWTALPETGVEPGHAAPPVFLVGFPRSGTTLLDQILDAHPQVQVFEERPFLREVRNAISGYPEGLATMTEADRARIRAVYWEALSKEGADLEEKTVVNKMPLDMVHAGAISRIFPEARIILAERHPADCVLSCFMQDFVPNGAMLNFLTLEGAAQFYDRVFTLWHRYRGMLPLNVHEVRYERLIADLRGEVEPALTFLGLSWDDAVSDPAAHALARGTIRTPSYSQVTQPIYSSATDRWRRYVEQMKPVLPILAPHIERLGYSS